MTPCIKKQAIKEGNGACVRMTPEPDNPYDSHAVAFECLAYGGWYVIKKHVLDAITSGDIEFAWIKYKALKTTGAGYYATVRVTKKKEWPQIVHALSDTVNYCSCH